jgi:hypothetical protein
MSFPGRWIGGVTLILGPALWLLGVLLRLPFHFFFPQQLQAYHDAPAQMTTAYACVLFGEILTAFGVVAIAQMIGRMRPGWATWGGVLVVLGLFTRVFHAGVDHLAFQLVTLDGPSAATETMATTYGAFQPISVFTPAILVGWIVLAIGAYLSRVLPLWRAIALGLMSGLMIGVLKGSTWWSMACACFATVRVHARALSSRGRLSSLRYSSSRSSSDGSGESSAPSNGSTTPRRSSRASRSSTGGASRISTARIACPVGTSSRTPFIHKLEYCPPASSASTTALMPSASSALCASSASIRDANVRTTTRSGEDME